MNPKCWQLLSLSLSLAREPSLFFHLCNVAFPRACARLRPSTSAQPSDFVLLRHTLAMPAHGANVGVEGMALAESDFVRNLSSVAEQFGCVGHYVDQHMLFLAEPSRQPPAARSPPGRRFSPPLFERYKNVGVVQLWGLRHCVLAARSHLGDVFARQTKDVKHVLGIGMDAVHHAEHELQRNGINIPGVSSSSGLPRSADKKNTRRVFCCCKYLWLRGVGLLYVFLAFF